MRVTSGAWPQPGDGTSRLVQHDQPSGQDCQALRRRGLRNQPALISGGRIHRPHRPTQVGDIEQAIQRYHVVEVAQRADLYRRTASAGHPLQPACRLSDGIDGAIWADGALSPKLKDLAYLRASIHNGCVY